MITYAYNDFTYHIWNQRRLGDPYLSAHGCSFCALASLINAVCDPSVTPVSLRQNAPSLLGTSESSRRNRYSPLQLAVQRQPVFELLGWSDRMPLNIAGAVRILECYMDIDYLDGASENELRTFLLAKADAGLPVLATGRYIPSVSGADLCPHATHSFLILGKKDKNTLIVGDSAGFEDPDCEPAADSSDDFFVSREGGIKYVHIDDLVHGIFRSGIRRGLAGRQYYFTPGTAGGVVSPAYSERIYRPEVQTNANTID